jgi:hypothetical protein
VGSRNAVTRRSKPGHAAAIVRWDLFIDESGDFADLDDEVVVAGLLIHGDTPGSNPAQLRRSLQAAAPDLPWPLKASDLNLPVLFALARTARSGPTPCRDDAIAAVVARLRQSAAVDVETLIGELRAGRRAPYDALARLEQVARQDWAQYQALRSLAGESAVQIGRLIRALADQTQATPSPVLLAACGETARGDISPSAPAGTDAETRRYLDLLRWVVSRAADIVARFDGKQHIHLHVLDRWVGEEILGQTRRAPLHLRHVSPLVREVERAFSTDSATRLSIKLDQISVYDERMHPALVLADFVANRVRRSLRHPAGRLALIESALLAEVHCTVRSGEPAASHLAAAGWAQESIEQVRQGNPDVAGAPPARSRDWAVEQASEWCEVLRR